MMSKIYFVHEGKIHMTRATIDQVAKAFLSLESMTPKKLQKLCYYAYAWYLTLNGEHLFLNQFEAWVHGPVDPGLYRQYKSYGWQEIPKREDLASVPENTYRFVQEVFNAYGELNGDELEFLTHDEAPWRIARNGLPDYATCSNLISDKDIVDFYSKEILTE